MSSLSSEQIIQIFEKCGALRRNDHFVYVGDRHGPDYVDKNAVTCDVRAVSALAHEVAYRCVERPDSEFPEVVVGPAMSGALLAALVAQQLNLVPDWPTEEQPNGTRLKALFTEKDAVGRHEFRRGFDKIVKGRRTLIVEDIVNSAKSVRFVAEAVVNAGGIITGIIALWNRGDVRTVSLAQMQLIPRREPVKPVPIISLVEHELPTYEPDSCPLCKAEVPINKDFGHGAKFLKAQNEKNLIR